MKIIQIIFSKNGNFFIIKIIYEYKITEGTQELSGLGLEHKNFLDSEHRFGHGLGQCHHFEQGHGLKH